MLIAVSGSNEERVFCFSYFLSSFLILQKTTKNPKRKGKKKRKKEKEEEREKVQLTQGTIKKRN